MCFAIGRLSRLILELGHYPNYFWNWEIIPIIEFPEVSVPQRGESAVLARNLMSTIQQLRLPLCIRFIMI